MTLILWRSILRANALCRSPPAVPPNCCLLSVSAPQSNLMAAPIFCINGVIWIYIHWIRFLTNWLGIFSRWQIPFMHGYGDSAFIRVGMSGVEDCLGVRSLLYWFPHGRFPLLLRIIFLSLFFPGFSLFEKPVVHYIRHIHYYIVTKPSTT